MYANITTDERKILLMLLLKEENTLHVEINHAFHREFKTILKEILKKVSALAEKLKVTDLNLV